MIRLLRRYVRRLVPIAVLGALAAVAETVSIVAIVPVAQTIADGRENFTGSIGPLDINLTINQLLLIGLLGVVSALLVNLIGAILIARLRASYLYHERMELWDRYLSANWTRQSSEREGRLQAHNAFVNAGALALFLLSNLAVSVASIAVMIVAAFVINPISTLIMLGLGGAVASCLVPVNRLLKKLSRRTGEADLALSESISEVSTHIRDLKTFGVLGWAFDHLEHRTARLRDLQRRSTTISNLVTPIYRGVGLLVVLLLLFVASQQADLNVAGFGAIALLLLRTLGFGQRVQNGVSGIVGAVGPLENLERTRTEFEGARESFGGRDLSGVDSLRLEAVTYTYEGDTPAVVDVDLTIPHGEVIGLAGPSGSGKSTLSQILIRLREPTGGQYLVGGYPAGEYSAGSWSRHFALVPQSTSLFHGTVHDNIAVYREHLTRDDVIGAATAAGIHETIESLPAGYETLLGTTQRDLSGGQVQRIGVARALCGSPSVLILDEPTSALDAAAETVIQDTLTRIRGSMIIVVIAHRLSTLAICDRVIELDTGRVARIGPSREVLAALSLAFPNDVLDEAPCE